MAASLFQRRLRCFGNRRAPLTLLLTGIGCFSFGFIVAYYLLQSEATLMQLKYVSPVEDGDALLESEKGMKHFRIPITVPPIKREKIENVDNQPGNTWDLFEKESNSVPINYDVHTFYYAWYGNLKFNNAYLHWAHPRLAHFNSLLARGFSRERHVPPGDIGANFYPLLGLYSSSDSSLLRRHMSMIRATGVGVIVVSWYPPGMGDDNGAPVDHLMPSILDAANVYKLKVAFHVEDYPHRNSTNLATNIAYILQKYAIHPAYYHRAKANYSASPSPRSIRRGLALYPVLFFYDSYRLPTESWSRVLKVKPVKELIRDSKTVKKEIFSVGLYLERRNGDCIQLRDGGFDAAYSYFAAQSISYGSSSHNWPDITTSCRKVGIEFFPSIGPGYLDTAVRPWNEQNTVLRQHGTFYRQRFEAAISVFPSALGITSFNEWHEGTQIEPAIPQRRHKGSASEEEAKRDPEQLDQHLPYHNYKPNSPYFYLRLTREFVRLYTQQSLFHNVTSTL